MSSYQKTNEVGKCDMCRKDIKGFHHLYKCPNCGFGVCSDCLKKGPTCRCNRGIPPLTEEQQGKMNTLMEMGFPDYICVHALNQFHWSIEESIPWIIENLETFPKPEIIETKQIEVKEIFDSDELDKIEDKMKYIEKEVEIGDDFVKNNKRKSSSRRNKKEDREDEWHEDVFDDDLYDLGRGIVSGDPTIEKCYEVIESNEIISMITGLCKRESEALSLSEGNVSILLRATEWSADKLEQRYFEDSERMCKDNGIISEEPKVCEEPTCPICYEEGKMISLSCGHYFCVKCWKERLSTMLETVGSNIVDCLCMEHGCSCKVNYEFVKQLSDEYIFKRFMYFICKDFISHRKSYVFCPIDTCGRAIHYFDTSRNDIPIVCKCGQRFCFKCGREMHKPVSCEQFMQWNDLVSNDSESMKFVNTISKPCFHCGLYTERVDGCNHMTCSRCHGQWCWMCRGDWSTHGSHTGGFYKCNLYDKSDAKKLDDQAKQLKEENTHFLEYFDEFIKYNNIIRDLTKREEVLVQIERNLEKLNGKPVHDLTKASEICKEAYSVIKYSYVFAFFIKDYDQINKLFCFRQEKDIETVNQLGELLKFTNAFGFEEIQKLRHLTVTVKKITLSLSDVSTENLMRNRFEEVKKKKEKKDKK